ncbi:MAG: hypothetical protein Q9188_003160 [Gyalolechia gomerana]
MDKIQGDAAYKQTMRSARLLNMPSTSQYPLGHQDDRHKTALSQMLKGLRRVTESRIASAVSTAEIVVPFSVPVSPAPAQLYDVLASVTYSLRLDVPLLRQPATGIIAARTYGLGQECTWEFWSTEQLILSLDYSRAALTAMLIQGECCVYLTAYDRHDTSLGLDGLAQIPHNGGPLRNFTSQPVGPGGNEGLEYIDELVLLGESANGQLRDTLEEDLGGQHFARLFNPAAVRMETIDPLWVAARGTAHDCWLRMDDRNEYRGLRPTSESDIDLDYLLRIPTPTHSVKRARLESFDSFSERRRKRASSLTRSLHPPECNLTSTNRKLDLDKQRRASNLRLSPKKSHPFGRPHDRHLLSPSSFSSHPAINAASSTQPDQASLNHLLTHPTLQLISPQTLTSLTGTTTLFSDRSTPILPIQQLRRAPLTRENLKKFNDQSPNQLKKSASSMTSSTSTDPAEVWRQLERNHIHDNDPQGAKLGEKIITDAKAIINNFRKSVMEEEELEDIADVMREYKTAGETTFLVHLWEVLLKKKRQKRPDLTDQEWITTAWAEDGLRCNWQEHFDSKWVPQLEDHGDPRLIWLYENAPKVKTPWPDMTYGYTRSSCDYIIQEIAERYDAILCKEMHFPWCFVEGKGAGQPFAAAGHQKARAGATAVYHLRTVGQRMDEEVTAYRKSHGQPAPSQKNTSNPKSSTSTQKGKAKKKYPYIDESAVVFSLSVSPDLAHLDVHFAEERDALTTHYHMHTIGLYHLPMEADIRDLRNVSRH